MVLPGEDRTVEIKMLKPVVLEEGQNFTIRDNNGTIGTGEEKDTESDDTNDTLAGKVTKLNKNMTEEKVELMSLNKTKRAKRLAAKGRSCDNIRVLPKRNKNIDIEW